MNGHRKIFKVDIMQKVQIVLTISSTNQDLKKKKKIHTYTHTEGNVEEKLKIID